MSGVSAHIFFLSSVLISPLSSTHVIISSVLTFPAASSLSWFAPVFVTLLSFIFQSQSGNLLHHLFHHLLQPFHFFHQTLHLCAYLARKHKTLPSSLSPCLTTHRAHKMDPTTTVAAYQMLANCYMSLLRCHPKKSVSTRCIYNVTKTMDLQSIYTQTQLDRVGLPNPCFFAHSAGPVATRWTKPSKFEPTNLKISENIYANVNLISLFIQ